jgi:hypothetical protein
LVLRGGYLGRVEDNRGWLAGVLIALCVAVLCCAGTCLGGYLLVGARHRPCVAGRPSGITVEHLAGRYSTARGGQLVLARSGTFTSTDIVIDLDNQPRTLSGPGTWTLLSRDEGFGDIRLGFTEARFAAYLSISGTTSDPWLYWYIGDPDLCNIQRFDRA